MSVLLKLRIYKSNNKEDKLPVLIIDDILLSPLKGFAAVCRHVQEAAIRDLKNQKSEIIAALAELHQQLESGRIDEKQFDIRETKLLERLENIEKMLGVKRG